MTTWRQARNASRHGARSVLTTVTGSGEGSNPAGWINVRGAGRPIWPAAFRATGPLRPHCAQAIAYGRRGRHRRHGWVRTEAAGRENPAGRFEVERDSHRGDRPAGRRDLLHRAAGELVRGDVQLHTVQVAVAEDLDGVKL